MMKLVITAAPLINGQDKADNSSHGAATVTDNEYLFTWNLLEIPSAISLH